MSMLNDLNKCLSKKGIDISAIVPDEPVEKKVQKVQENKEPVAESKRSMVDMTEDLMKCIAPEEVEVLDEAVRSHIIDKVDYDLLKDLFKR